MTTISPPKLNWFPANLPQISRRFEKFSTADILRWGVTTFDNDLAMASGFGVSGIVMMHIASQLPKKPTIFYLQTDLHFSETMELRNKLAARLGLEFVEVRTDMSLAKQTSRHGAELWRSNPDLCCQIRKVEPMRRFLADKAVWVTGIRRDQSPSRANAPIVSWDETNHLIKLCPMANWTKENVWTYIKKHDLPYNKLHDEGYPSIGCRPCTNRVADGVTDERAGRWSGKAKTECGLHFQNGKMVRLSTIAAVK